MNPKIESIFTFPKCDTMPADCLLQVGQAIHSDGMYAKRGIITEIRGTQQRGNAGRKAGGLTFISNNCADIGVIYENGTKCILSEYSIRDYRLFDHVVSQLDVDAVQAFAVETEEERIRLQEEEKLAKENRREAIAKEQAGFLQTVKDNPTISDYALGAKNLKKELSRAFPGTAFKVSSKGYAGGCSIDVHWEKGPTVKMVEAYSAKYQDGYFNGMEDIYEYNSDRVWTDVFGGAKFVSESRSETEALREEIARSICILHNKEYIGSNTMAILGDWDDEPLSRHIYQVLCQLDLQKAVKFLRARHSTMEEYKSYHNLPRFILEFEDKDGKILSSIDLSQDLRPATPYNPEIVTMGPDSKVIPFPGVRTSTAKLQELINC